LYNRDRRNESKPFFKRRISYIYYAYCKNSDLKNLLPEKRKEKAAEIVEVDYKELESNTTVRNVIKLYIDIQTTHTERLYIATIKRVEETINWLNELPIKKRVKQKILVEYDVPGKIEKESRHIMVDVEIDNSDEVKKALTMAELLTNQLETLKKKITKENLESRKTGRMFDNISQVM